MVDRKLKKWARSADRSINDDDNGRKMDSADAS